MKAVDMREYSAIAETLQDYVDGARVKTADTMKKAFHQDAMIFGHIEGHLLADPINALFEWHEETGPASDVVVHFSILDVAETIAVVRVEADNWAGHRFTDYLSLLKIEDKWQVINKIFHNHEE